MKNFTKILSVFLVIFGLMSFVACKAANDITNAVSTAADLTEEWNRLPDAPKLESAKWVCSYYRCDTVKRQFAFYNDNTFQELQVIDTSGDNKFTEHENGDVTIEIRGTYTGNPNATGDPQETITLTLTGYVIDKYATLKIITPKEKILWESLNLTDRYAEKSYYVGKTSGIPTFFGEDFELQRMK